MTSGSLAVCSLSVPVGWEGGGRVPLSTSKRVLGDSPQPWDDGKRKLQRASTEPLAAWQK